MFTLVRFLFIRPPHSQTRPGYVHVLGQNGFFLGRIGLDHLTYLPATVTGPRQAATLKSPQAAGTVKGG